MINIDGSVLEGGGQILRNATALSCILNKPIRITKIRAGRDKPGLRAQHLSGLEVLRDLSCGYLKGGYIGSTDIEFSPKCIESGDFIADTKTAGSVCLLIQAALPCMLLAKGATKLTLKGGTNASMAPPIDYFLQVFKPILQKIGITFHCRLNRRGYYPKGGGEVVLSVEPIKCIPPFKLTNRGELKCITGKSFVSGVLPIKMANEMSECAKRHLNKCSFKNVCIETSKETEAFGNGSCIMLVAETTNGFLFGSSGLGERGVSNETIGLKCAEELVSNLLDEGCVDQHLQDQLIILMSLANGHSVIECGAVTLHTHTAIHIAQLLTNAVFKITEVSPTLTRIECEGIGFINNSLNIP